jgi:hypothetical protein
MKEPNVIVGIHGKTHEHADFHVAQFGPIRINLKNRNTRWGLRFLRNNGALHASHAGGQQKGADH